MIRRNKRFPNIAALSSTDHVGSFLLPRLGSGDPALSVPRHRLAAVVVVVGIAVVCRGRRGGGGALLHLRGFDRDCVRSEGDFRRIEGTPQEGIHHSRREFDRRGLRGGGARDGGGIRWVLRVHHRLDSVLVDDIAVGVRCVTSSCTIDSGSEGNDEVGGSVQVEESLLLLKARHFFLSILHTTLQVIAKI